MIMIKRPAGYQGSRSYRFACSPQGFTLIEALVAVLVGVNVLLILWTVFRADQRRFFGDQARFTGLQGALLFEGYLARDLGALAVRLPNPTRPVDPSSPPFDINSSVVIDQQGSRLRFLMARSDDASFSVEPVEVTYSLDPRTFRVLRNVDGVTRPLPNVIAEDLRFSLLLLKPTPERLGIGIPPFRYNADQTLHFLKLQITCVSEMLRDRPEERRKAEERITVNQSIPIRARSERIRHPYWLADGVEYVE